MKNTETNTMRTLIRSLMLGSVVFAILIITSQQAAGQYNNQRESRVEQVSRNGRLGKNENFVEMLGHALKSVLEMDWTTWRPQPGDFRIAEYLFADQPPLTEGILQAYLGNCAWIWQRPIPLAEQKRVRDALVKLWLEDGLDLDFSRLNEISSFVLMFREIASAIPAKQEALRQELSRNLPIGAFPGIDVEIPGIAAAKEMLGPLFPPSTLRSPAKTGMALDGLYLANTSGLQLNIYGPPGSGTWGSQTELYAFFPDGSYLYFPSGQEAGAHFKDPKGHKAYKGSYEIVGRQIKIYDGSNGKTHTSDFSVSKDGMKLKFYGKTFTRVADTTGLRD